jgi:hypothetical protein
MSPYPDHMINDIHDDDGWGFYVVLDLEESFVNIISLQKQYTRRVSALPTIEEGNETVESQEQQPTNPTKDEKNILTTEHAHVYFVFMISCLYVWIILSA